MIYVIGKCLVLCLFINLSSGAYLTGSINTTQFHTDFWYHLGDQIRLVCYLNHSSGNGYPEKFMWWKLIDRYNEQMISKASSINDVPGNKLSTFVLVVTLQWYHNSSLLKCQYGEIGNRRIVNEISLMNVRLLLNTTATPAARYTGIASSINSTSMYNEYRYSVGERLRLVCYPLRDYPDRFGSVIEWTIKDRGGRDQTTALQKFIVQEIDSHIILRMTLTEKHDGWTVQCTHRETSVSEITVESLIVILKKEDAIRGGKILYIAMGSLCATIIISCIIYFIWIHLPKDQKTVYATLQFEQQPSNTVAPQEPYAEAIVNNSHHNSGCSETANEERIYINPSEPYYAEIDYAQCRLQPRVSQKIEDLYAKPRQKYDRNKKTEPSEATSKNEAIEKEE